MTFMLPYTEALREAVSTAPQIAMADPDGRVNLWCSITQRIRGGASRYEVINGGWWFILDEQIGLPVNAHPRVDLANFAASSRCCWAGTTSHGDRDYSEAIEWIQGEVDAGRYVSIPVPEERQEESEYDDIPF